MTIIFTNNDEFRIHYHRLGPDHAFIGRLRLKESEEAMLLDLETRGVTLFPSGLAQQSCRSKVIQATLFAQQMLPHSTCIHDQHDLLTAVNTYGGLNIEKVVTKLDRKNAGLGIHLFNSVEDVYNMATLGSLKYPFVLQPFQTASRDIRVIIIDDYVEAYWRENPNGFRNNLHCGGASKPCTLTDDQLSLCHQVMSRGRYPYAHLDLMITLDNKTYLAEINLRGGIHGAQISAGRYQELIKSAHQRFIKSLQDPA